jgi:hypothetical protein
MLGGVAQKITLATKPFHILRSNMAQQKATSQWALRLQAFELVARDLSLMYQAKGVPFSLLAQALDNLSYFASSMFDFYNSNFPPQGQILKASSQNPPDYIYSRILERVGDDLEVIQRAAEQRCKPVPSLAAALQVTDYLAKRMITQAVTGGLLEEGTQVVTYFQKSATVRVMPYVGLALIGVPYSVLKEPRDLLSIPHEIGHYVFWHGESEPNAPSGSKYHLSRMLFEEALTALRGLMGLAHPTFDQWCYVWLEEVFADVLACWLAGPCPALSIQDLASSHSQTHFMTSDDDHPVPLIRPYVHMKALAAQNNEAWTVAAGLLNDQWNITARRNLDSFKLKDGRGIDISEALVAGYTLNESKPVDCLIDVILKRLRKFGSLAADDWRYPFDTPVSIDDLGQQFDAFCSRLPKAEELQASSQGVEANLPEEGSYRQWALDHLDWPADEAENEDTKGARNLKRLLQGEELTDEVSLDETVWKPAVATGGWTTEPGEIPWPR